MAVVLDRKLESGFPYWASVCRRFGPDSSFFASGNIERELLAKQAALDFSEDEKYQLENMATKDGSSRTVKEHLVDKHKFPTSVDFFKKGHPSKNQRQKHHCKQALHNKEASTNMEVEDETIDDLVSAVSKLSTSDSSPSSISFGHHHNRGLIFISRAAVRERRPEATSAGTKR